MFKFESTVGRTWPEYKLEIKVGPNSFDKLTDIQLHLLAPYCDAGLMRMTQFPLEMKEQAAIVENGKGPIDNVQTAAESAAASTASSGGSSGGNAGGGGNSGGGKGQR